MNEEDIKIIESLIDDTKKSIKENIENLSENRIANRIIAYTALENLINRNKVLEEENRIFALEGCRVRLKMYIDKNYIPKSKIKEKIEEYRGKAKEFIKMKEYNQADIKMFYVYALQELLEKRK